MEDIGESLRDFISKLVTICKQRKDGTYQVIELLDITNISQCIEDVRNVTERIENEAELMDLAGELYNGSKVKGDADIEFMLLMRLLACNVMYIACAANFQDTLDTMRCFTRIALSYYNVYKKRIQKLEKTESSHDDNWYLAQTECCVQQAMNLWDQIGLEKLARVASKREIEEISEDIWEILSLKCELFQKRSFKASDLEKDNPIQIIKELRTMLTVNLGNTERFIEAVLRLSEWIILPDNEDPTYPLVTETKIEILQYGLTFLGMLLEQSSQQKNKKQRDERIKMMENVVSSLSSVYCEMENYQKAKSCIELIQGYNENPRLLCLFLKIYMRQSDYEKALDIFLNDVVEICDYDVAIENAIHMAQIICHDVNIVLTIFESIEKNFVAQIYRTKFELIKYCINSRNVIFQSEALNQMKILTTMLMDLADIEKKENVQNDYPRFDSKDIRDLIMFTAERSRSLTEQERYAEACEWCENALLLSTQNEVTVYFKRLMAICLIQCQKYAEAVAFAKDCCLRSPGRTSYYALFQTLLYDENATEKDFQDVIDQAIHVNDFDPHDLWSYAREAHKKQNTNVTMSILFSLAEILDERFKSNGELPCIPYGILLHNVFKHIVKEIEETESSPEKKTKAATLVDIFNGRLIPIMRSLDRRHFVEQFGPLNVVKWFYVVCQRVAYLSSTPILLLCAAEISKIGSSWCTEESSNPFDDLERKSKMLYISLQLENFKSLTEDDLQMLLSVVENVMEADLANTDKAFRLKKIALMLKVNLSSEKLEDLLSLCQNISSDVDELEALGVFALNCRTSRSLNIETRLRPIYSNVAFECTKLSVQYTLKKSISMDDQTFAKITTLIQRLVELSSSKDIAIEWAQQLYQMTVAFKRRLPIEDAEWLASKVWNMGVSTYRLCDTENAKKYMTLALNILEISDTKSHLAQNLHDQYDRMLQQE